MRTLRELQIGGTRISEAGAKRLGALMPETQIVTEMLGMQTLTRSLDSRYLPVLSEYLEKIRREQKIDVATGGRMTRDK